MKKNTLKNLVWFVMVVCIALTVAAIVCVNPLALIPAVATLTASASALV